MVTVSCINKAFTKSEYLRPLVKKIVDFCIENNVILQAEHIPGVDNVFADAISRKIDRDDWAINRQVFEDIASIWGPYDIDRMATAFSAVVPRYNSQLWDVGAEAVDAFTLDWGGVNNWIFPPFGAIARTVRHIRNCRAWGTLIVPRWPAQVWWPAVLTLTLEMFTLPRIPDLFVHSVFGVYGYCRFDFVVCLFDCR
jgi:hypothetical protein